jgi:hypothetical protein
MKCTAAKSVLAEFFEMEDTASGYIARCPVCRVRFAVNVKRDAVADEYVKLLQEHASTEKIMFENDEEVRAWLRRDKAKAKSLLTYLEQAAQQADPMQYKVLRPALLQLKDLAPDERSSTMPVPDTLARKSSSSAKT